MSLADRQSAFGAAILDNRLPAPEGLVGPDGKHSPRRFAVYRNNVIVGLIDALSDAFPTLRRVVGDEFFRAMAGFYARTEPPVSPILLNYGGGIPAFLEIFPPVAHLPYLADLARIERAWVEAYHAAEAVPADVSPLLAMTPAVLGGQRFSFHPSVRVIRSVHPVLTIWQINQPGQTPAPVNMTVAEDALILRPIAEVTIQRLDPGVAGFLQRLMAGSALSAAAAASFVETPRFDFAKALSALLLSGALTGWQASV
ncbi:MAG: DNA-binding domain-containing protein [Cypionkella sp.]